MPTLPNRESFPSQNSIQQAAHYVEYSEIKGENAKNSLLLGRELVLSRALFRAPGMLVIEPTNNGLGLLL